jgi:hypothetical protein
MNFSACVVCAVHFAAFGSTPSVIRSRLSGRFPSDLAGRVMCNTIHKPETAPRLIRPTIDKRRATGHGGRADGPPGLASRPQSARSERVETNTWLCYRTRLQPPTDPADLPPAPPSGTRAPRGALPPAAGPGNPSEAQRGTAGPRNADLALVSHAPSRCGAPGRRYLKTTNLRLWLTITFARGLRTD